jgi:hypothetical protein
VSKRLSGGHESPGMGYVTWLCPCWTESLMEKPAFTRACLSDVRVIMLLMCVPLVE